MRAWLLIAVVGCTEPLEEPAGETLVLQAYRDPCTSLTGETHLCFPRNYTGPFDLVGHAYEWGVETVVRGKRDGDRFIVDEVISREPVAMDTLFMLFPAPPADGSSPWFTRTSGGLEIEGTVIPCDAARCDQIVAASNRVFSLTVRVIGPHALDVVEID